MTIRVLAAMVFAAGIQASAQGAPHADSGMIVSTVWLAQHARDRDVVLLHVDVNDSGYRAGHIPGAHFVNYGAIIRDADGNSTELPAFDSLRSLFEAVGVSSASHVVITGPPLAAARAFFTLDYMQVPRVSLLDGGTSRWKGEQRALELATPAAIRGHLTTAPRPSVVATSAWIVPRLGKPGIAVFDTRREEEFSGVVTDGHLPGARRLEWQDLFHDPSEMSLKSIDELERIWHERAAPGDTIVAYCRVGHRSSMTYFVSRLLGYPVKLYDGSYEDWKRRGLVLVK